MNVYGNYIGTEISRAENEDGGYTVTYEAIIDGKKIRWFYLEEREMPPFCRFTNTILNQN